MLDNYLSNKRIACEKVLSHVPDKVEDKKKDVCMSPTMNDKFSAATPPASQELEASCFKKIQNEVASKDLCSNDKKKQVKKYSNPT